MQLPQALTQALERLSAAGPVEVYDGGEWLAALAGFRYEVRQQDEVVLLHLWSPERTLVRRILRITDEAEEPKSRSGSGGFGERLTVETLRFGQSPPGRLEFVTVHDERPAARVLRELFRARFRDLLARCFPDETPGTFTTAPDLEHSLSGNYTRGVMKADSSAWALLGAAPGESVATCDAMLTFGLLWLDRARRTAKGAAVGGLRLFFPAGTAGVTAHRLQALTSSTRVELYEYDAQTWRARRVDVTDGGNLHTFLVPRREVESTLAQAQPAVDRIRALAPASIEVTTVPGSSEVALRFRGLLFARSESGGILFGAGDPQTPLTPEREREIERLVRELATHRSPSAQKTKHPLYRAQPERWLESLVAAEPSRVDARLDPRFLYAQVPAISANDRGIVDLLGVTREGRLTVMELKASEDIQLVLQAVDYWLRVRWHQTQNDFARYGYFPGILLDPRPPLLFLVAPALQFHPASDLVLRYLIPGIEIHRVGFSESWRRGLKVVLRQRCNG